MCICVCACTYECETQMMLADGPSNGSPPVIKLPYSSTACSLMNLLSAILATLALSDTEKRHSAGAVTAVANTDTIASQTTDIVRYILIIDHSRNGVVYNFGRVCPSVCMSVDNNFRKP